MKYKIDFAKKGKYSTEATVIDEQNQKLEVLLGKELENTMQGTTVEGKLWTSPKNGKVYLFEEKMKSAPAGMKPDFMKKNIDKAMERKETSIKGFQDDKNMAIKVSSTFRDATILTVAEFGDNSYSDEHMRNTWLKWRNWLLNNFDVDFRDLEDPLK